MEPGTGGTAAGGTTTEPAGAGSHWPNQCPHRQRPLQGPDLQTPPTALGPAAAVCAASHPRRSIAGAAGNEQVPPSPSVMHDTLAWRWQLLRHIVLRRSDFR